MNPRQDGRGLILMVEHLGNDDGLGWRLSVGLWKTTACLVTSLPGGREYLTLFRHTAEVSDGSCGLPLVKSFLILCKYTIVTTYGVWCLWNLLRGKKF